MSGIDTPPRDTIETYRDFPRDQLVHEYGLPGTPDKTKVLVLEDHPIDTNRWAIVFELIFQLVEDNDPTKAWRVIYLRGATELQEQGLWENSNYVSAERMQLVTKQVWEVIE